MKNQNLIAARKKSGKTQKQAADEINLNIRMYQRYETGVGSNTIQTAIRIAKMYNTTVEKLWSTSVV